MIEKFLAAGDFLLHFYFSKYVTIYRSISKLSYIDRYMISNIDRYMKFSKNHFSTDICRKFSFFDRYMKFFIFHKINIFGSYSLIGSIKTSYVGHYNNAYIGLYKNVYKTLGDLAYIDLYTPYRFAASRSYIDRYMLGHLVFSTVIISTDICIIVLIYI